MKDFLVNVLGFYVSDVVGEDFAYFLRCNAEHHGIALIKGRGTIHHHAWHTQSIVDEGPPYQNEGPETFASGSLARRPSAGVVPWSTSQHSLR